MSASYKIYSDPNYVLISYAGSITAAESMENFVAVTQDSAWSPDLDTLIDMSKATKIDINFNQMMGMSMEKEPIVNAGIRSKVSFWAPDDLAFGIARMYASINGSSKGQDIQVFRDKNEALKFLGLA